MLWISFTFTFWWTCFLKMMVSVSSSLPSNKKRQGCHVCWFQKAVSHSGFHQKQVDLKKTSIYISTCSTLEGFPPLSGWSTKAYCIHPPFLRQRINLPKSIPSPQKVVCRMTICRHHLSLDFSSRTRCRWTDLLRLTDMPEVFAETRKMCVEERTWEDVWSYSPVHVFFLCCLERIWRNHYFSKRNRHIPWRVIDQVIFLLLSEIMVCNDPGNMTCL